MRPIPADNLGHAHGLMRAIDERGRVRIDEFVTQFDLEDLFPPDLENALGRMRHFISYARAAGLVKEDRGVVELTDVGRRYIRAGDPEQPFTIVFQQAEWLRRQLREKHMTDSIFHGLAIGLSLLASCPPGMRVSTLDFGRSMAYLGRAGWDNDNTLLIQGQRHLTLLSQLDLIDDQHRLTPTGEQMRSELTLPVHMSLTDLAAQLNPGGAEAVRAAAEEEWATAAPEPPAEEPAPPPVAEAPPAEDESEENGYHTVIGSIPAVAPEEPSGIDYTKRREEPMAPPPASDPVVPPPAGEPVAPPPVSSAPPPSAAPPAGEPPASAPPPAGAETPASAPPPAAETPAGPPPAAAPPGTETPASAPPPAAAETPAVPPAAQTPPSSPPAAETPAVPPVADTPPPAGAETPASAPPPAAAETPAVPPAAQTPPSSPLAAAPPAAETPAVPPAAEPPASPPPVAPAGPPPAAAPSTSTPPPAAAPPVEGGVPLVAGVVPGPARPRPATPTPVDPGDETVVAPVRRPAFIEPGAIRAAAEQAGLRLPEGVYANVAAALGAGKHLLLTGAPGSGKTTLALAVARAAAQAGRAHGAMVVTGAPPSEVLIEAAGRARWVIADELDQGDLDAELGPLSTFLGGTPITHAGEDIAPADGWRIVATALGTEPKARILRRFATVEVSAPAAEDLRRLLRTAANGDESAVRAAEQLQETGLGAGVLLEAARHAAARNAAVPADAETLAREVYAAYVATRP